jgi:hypothetical protein
VPDDIETLSGLWLKKSHFILPKTTIEFVLKERTAHPEKISVGDKFEKSSVWKAS